MLSLTRSTSPDWAKHVASHVEAVLIDHAHCEKKAAGTAMNLIFSYVEHVSVVRRLADIVKEELGHFQEVLGVLESRGIVFSGQPPSRYGRRLADHIRTREPEKALDRCVVAALIEARSCERFQILRDHLPDRELAAFYGRLMESEARHHATYLELARHFVPEVLVRARVRELAEVEGLIIAEQGDLPRLHA